MSGEGWAYVATANPLMLDDAPVLESWKAHTIVDAEAKAREQGYVLTGDPAERREPGWMIEGKDGPLMVGASMARLAGVDVNKDRPSIVRFLFEWPSGQVTRA
jgi:hypothetical protein